MIWFLFIMIIISDSSMANSVGQMHIVRKRKANLLIDRIEANDGKIRDWQTVRASNGKVATTCIESQLQVWG